jgi:hypothetical protein
MSKKLILTILISAFSGWIFLNCIGVGGYNIYAWYRDWTGNVVEYSFQDMETSSIKDVIKQANIELKYRESK